MPIAIKDYTWEESDTDVHITVPIKGNNSSKADLFSSDEYIKVNSPPYFFEMFLYAGVDDSKSVAQLGDGVIVFKLIKKELGIWGQLSSSTLGDKDKMKARRDDAVTEKHRRIEEETEEKRRKKREKEKLALNEQMRLENEEREKIHEIKQTEIRQATEEIEDWKKKHQVLPGDEPHPAYMTGHDDGDDEHDEEDDDEVHHTPEDKKALIDKLPPPRTRQNISVTFTPRVFPTPMRESRVHEEDEWLRKQAEARRIPEIEDEDLAPEERDPFWLKDKGDSFFKGGNFQAAVNAYNTAIRLNGKVPAFYSNRGACHLKLRNFIKCIEDCSKAIELLTPPVPANASSRLRAHTRRGTAFCELELYAEGLQDYVAALKIEPKNEQLRQDAERIRHVIQGTT
ncbi:dynein assembly factor 4, axonemal [Strongylocentrotus purpuratus]|uniref:Dynein axonemal assembly factor 4 n=1 Tax=Strongylocentrotus purpuratus TaxID=7668 RepID=A0A7M7RFH5_STRPU|nr:dynein assembly factor 4, axonemal [Strongylocentrotus purpuratus]|eukprot:XP_787717.1 PREDICTED: dyslexia susceptibility 1 candidate gene 1 protein homolog [Strongylocentrotus purpuratus]